MRTKGKLQVKKYQTKTGNIIKATFLRHLVIAMGLSLIARPSALAQNESPLPGNNSLSPDNYMPSPSVENTAIPANRSRNATPKLSAPVPGDVELDSRNIGPGRDLNTNSPAQPQGSGESTVIVKPADTSRHPGSASLGSSYPGDTFKSNALPFASDTANREAGTSLDRQDGLPISLEDLQAIPQRMKTGDIPLTEENLNKYLVWLDTLIKAHNKLASAFARQEDTKPAYDNERALSSNLYRIKDQVLYHKAQILVKEKRATEAINILVDIAAVEPKSELGQQAYNKLKQMGFSPEIPTASAQSSDGHSVHQLSAAPRPSDRSSSSHPSHKPYKAPMVKQVPRRASSHHRF